jgi:multiple sugar transport system permease protein
MRNKRFSIIERILFLLITGACVFWAIFPMAWILLTAFRPSADFYAGDVTIIPKNWSISNFKDVLESGNFVHYMYNSLRVGVVVTFLSIIFSTLSAYAITRLRFPGRMLIARSIIASYLIPTALLFIPLYFLLTQVHLQNTLASLIISYLSATVPFCTWMLYGYFSTLPRSLDEAAVLDGCTKLNILLKIFIPLSLPGIAVVALYSFTLCWNEFLYALVFVTSAENMTIPAGIVQWIVEDDFAWGRLMAASALSVIPTFILYFFAQSSFKSGLVAGAVKQ